jgi:hypothetical protein
VYFARQSIPTIQVFDCRALFLYLLARQVPRAGGGILRFAGQPLGALSHLASIGALAILDRIPNPLTLLKPTPAKRQVLISKNG